MSFILLGILNAQAAGVAAGSYDLLETTVLTSSASSVSFTGLDSYTDYKHLQIRIVGQNTSNAPGTVFATFNSDTGNNYATHRLFGNGSSVGSDAFTSRANLFMGHIQDPNPTDAFAGSVVDILDPFSTTKNSTTRTLSGTSEPNFPVISIHSGLYVSTNAITSIELVPNETNFGTGSRFSLYGIKG